MVSSSDSFGGLVHPSKFQTSDSTWLRAVDVTAELLFREETGRISGDCSSSSSSMRLGPLIHGAFIQFGDHEEGHVRVRLDVNGTGAVSLSVLSTVSSAVQSESKKCSGENRPNGLDDATVWRRSSTSFLVTSSCNRVGSDSMRSWKSTDVSCSSTESSSSSSLVRSKMEVWV